MLSRESFQWECQCGLEIPLSGDKWLPGVVLSKDGSVTYQVELNNGRVRKCHVEQMRIQTVSSTETVPPDSPPETTSIPPSTVIPEQIVPSTSVTEPPVLSSSCGEPSAGFHYLVTTVA